MDKIEKKIIFDATVLVDGNDMKEERRGIYFVAKNLLEEFYRKCPNQLILYASAQKMSGLYDVCHELNISCPLYRKEPFFSAKLHKLVTFFRKCRMRFYKTVLPRKFFAFMIAFFGGISMILFFILNLFYRIPSNAIFFSPRTSAPYFFNRDRNVKKYIVLHDLIPYIIPEYAGKKWLGWFGYLIRHLNRNDFYFANSRATKNDFCNFSKRIDPNHVKVTYLASNENLKLCEDLSLVAQFKRKYGIPEDKEYVFALSSLEPRKNLIREIRSFLFFVKKNNIRNLCFVVGGNDKSNFERKMMEEFGGFDCACFQILHIGYIDDDDLPLFYNFAKWFVFTSQYEGFGLPALEAMQCGCPVIASNNSSLPEVVADAGLLIDWDDEVQHIEAYGKMYFDDPLRKTLSKNGLNRSKDFSWNKTAAQMLNEMDVKES